MEGGDTTRYDCHRAAACDRPPALKKLGTRIRELREAKGQNQEPFAAEVGDEIAEAPGGRLSVAGVSGRESPGSSLSSATSEPGSAPSARQGATRRPTRRPVFLRVARRDRERDADALRENNVDGFVGAEHHQLTVLVSW